VEYLARAEAFTVSGFFGNLIPVTAGNIIGGSIFVALTYWIIYRRQPEN